jgi:hypothetical protein
MAKLISKCCVCGRIYGVTTCDMNGLGKDEERYSHGFCSKACEKADYVQLAFWNHDMNCVDMTKGKMVEGVLYHAGEKVTHYTTHDRHERISDIIKLDMRTHGTVVVIE